MDITGITNHYRRMKFSAEIISLLKFIFLTVVFFVFSYAVSQWNMDEIADDGAFLLRYAENMLGGEFWVWNKGESPVWGASAPLYPLVVAFTLLLGFTGKAALHVTGAVLGAFAITLVCYTLVRRYNLISACVFLLVLLAEATILYNSANGLETPLTILFIALCFYCVMFVKNEWVVGLILGLTAIHKIDIAPVAFFALLGFAVAKKQVPFKAIMVSFIVCFAWYSFAWIYFGLPIPNTLVTKFLYQSDIPVTTPWYWIVKAIFMNKFREIWWLFMVAVLVLVKPRDRPILIFLIGIIVTHVVVYSLKYPFEYYSWYLAPSIFTSDILLACSVGIFVQYVKSKNSRVGSILLPVVLSVVIVYIPIVIKKNDSRVDVMNYYSKTTEHNKAEAGRWIEKNTPENFRLLTYWGLPAYYSQRYVIDASWLNRVYERPGTDAYLEEIQRYKPELVAMSFGRGESVEKVSFVPKGYVQYRTFDHGFANDQNVKFFVVFVREDLLERIKSSPFPLTI